MSTYGAKRRAIRHASDSAHAWARNLRLGDVHSKLLLSMLTLYVDGEGKAFVGLDQLAEDCEFSPDTVRRRLRWLEEIGAIARTAQWIDANGRRGAWGRGKRTSDEIRLLLDADADEIEARAAGIEQKIGGVSTPISPSQQQGLTTSADSVGPAPALGQPSHCGEGLDSSEPEPEPESPQPLRGEGEPGRDLEEPDDFAPAWSSWPGHEVMRRDLALAEFRLLSREKQRLCRAAIPQFVRMQERLGRTRPPNFHLWIRNAGFEEFPNATLETAAAPAASSFDVNSAEGKAIKALYAFARTSLFEHRGCVIYPLPVNAQVLAFADLPTHSAWHWIEERGQIAAWSAFLKVHIHRPHSDLLTTRGLGAEQRRGMLVPWPWPPRKDGTISPEAAGETGDAA